MEGFYRDYMGLSREFKGLGRVFKGIIVGSVRGYGGIL